MRKSKKMFHGFKVFRFARIPTFFKIRKAKKSKRERILSKIVELEKPSTNVRKKDEKLISLRKKYVDELMKEINKKIKEIKKENKTEQQEKLILSMLNDFEKLEEQVDKYKILNSIDKNLIFAIEDEVRKDNYSDVLEKIVKLLYFYTNEIEIVDADFKEKNKKVLLKIKNSNMIEDKIRKKIYVLLSQNGDIVNFWNNISNLVNDLKKTNLPELNKQDVEQYLKIALRQKVLRGAKEDVEIMVSWIKNPNTTHWEFSRPMYLESLLKIKKRQIEKILSDPTDEGSVIDIFKEISKAMKALTPPEENVFTKIETDAIYQAIKKVFDELKKTPNIENIEKIMQLDKNLDNILSLCNMNEDLQKEIKDFIKNQEINAINLILSADISNMAEAFGKLEVIESKRKLTDEEVNVFLKNIDIVNLTIEQQKSLSNFLGEVVFISEDRNYAIKKLASLKDDLDKEADPKWRVVKRYFFENPEKEKLDAKILRERLKLKKGEDDGYFIKAGGNIYQVNEPLGSGAFGKTKLCWNEKGEKFAIKVEGVASGMKKVDEKLKEKHREFKFMKKMNQGVAQVIVVEPGTFRNKDATGKIVLKETEAKTFTIMKYYEGGSLEDKLKIEELTSLEKLELAISVAESIKKCHKKGIVHYDVKPDNIMLTKKGKAELIDYGSARQVDEKREGGTLIYQPKKTSKNNYSYDEYAFLIMLVKDFRLFNPPDTVKKELYDNYFYNRLADSFCQEKYKITFNFFEILLKLKGDARKKNWIEMVQLMDPNQKKENLEKMYDDVGLADLTAENSKKILKEHVDQKMEKEKIWEFESVVDFGDFLDEKNRPDIEHIMRVLKKERDRQKKSDEKNTVVPGILRRNLSFSQKRENTPQSNSNRKESPKPRIR